MARHPAPTRPRSLFAGAARLGTGIYLLLRKTNPMSTIKLGVTPKSFKRVVKFDMLDGSIGMIEADFRYRTRDEFGKFIDGLVKDAGVQADQVEGLGMAGLMRRTTDQNGRYLMDILVAWNLPDELTLDNARALSNEVPAAAAALMETYRSAVTEGRLGN